MAESDHPSLNDWRTAGQIHRYGDHNVFYVDEGGDGDDDDVLLCVHGFPTASWDWSRVWSRLTDDFRVVAPDMVGFGFSDKPTNYGYSIFDQADLHEDLLDELDVGTVHVLAHDYGDTVVQEMLARDDLSFDIESICLLNGGIFYEEIRPVLVQRLLLSPVGFLVSRLITKSIFRRSFSDLFAVEPTEDELDDFWTVVTNNDGRRVVHEIIHYLDERREHRDRWVRALRDAEPPMRLVVGPEDPVSGAHMADRYEEIVPDPDVVRLDGIGHYPQWEDPEATLDAYFEFLGA